MERQQGKESLEERPVGTLAALFTFWEKNLKCFNCYFDSYSV